MISQFNISELLFFFFAAIAVLGALGVIFQKNPVTSAVFLVLTFFALACIYSLMNAVFLATMQVLVYAGAIMVLVIFVLMLLSLREESNFKIWENPIKRTLYASIAVIFAILINAGFQRGEVTMGVMKGYTFNQSQEKTLIPSDGKQTYEYSYQLNDIQAKGNIASVGVSTFVDYLLPFELLSLLLLVAVVGAVILAKKNQRKES
jgi:NADH-quinone oxidoreductase subunit J